MSLEPNSVSIAVRGLLFAKRLATRSTVLAGVGVFGAAGVAAAAVGAPVPVIESAFNAEEPTLVEVIDENDGREDTDAEAQDDEATEGEGSGGEAESVAVQEPQAAEDGSTGEDAADAKDTSVPDAAKSDCFKDRDEEEEPEGQAESSEPEVPATDAEAVVEDVDGCEGEFDNHGQYVSNEAHERNAERKAAKDEAKAAKKAERAEKHAEKKADRAEKHAEKKAERAEKHANKKHNGDDGTGADDGTEPTEEGGEELEEDEELEE